MEKVIISFECNLEAASILLPIIKNAQMLGDLGTCNYCCFHVDGEKFKISKVESEGVSIERAIVSAAAGFAYKMDDKLYKRFPKEHISLVDFGDSSNPVASAPKKTHLGVRRLEMEF